jgi:GntR family transcriptional regulator
VVDREESVRHGVRAQLREVIAASRAGQRLPSERDLSSRWGVARMTLRHAMNDLVLEGLVERRHGSGTYVAPQPFARFLGLTSFTQDMRDRGLVPGSRLVEYRAVPADETIAAQLDVPVGEQLVTFTRVRLGSGEPMALETVWIPTSFVPGLNRPDLEGSLYEVLARRYQIVAASASVTIEPVVPDDRTCDLLGIPAGHACLRLRMIDSDTRGRVVMVADCIYRGDRYQLSATLAGADFSSLQARRAG